MTQSKAPTSGKPKRSDRSVLSKILRELPIPLLILTPGFILLLLFSSAQQTLNKNAYDNLSYNVNRYYYAGWPVERLRHEVSNTKPTQAKEIADLTADLYYYIDRDQADISDRLRSSKETASMLYIEEIAQPTSHLEQLYENLEEGVGTENYDMISSNLYAIASEIEALREQQSDDIAYRVEVTAHSIESIHTVGLMYGISFENRVQSTQEITSDGSKDFATYMTLVPIKEEISKQLDEKIITRGGISTDGKRILISISTQRLYMIEDYDIIYKMPASTGISGHGTGVGEFQVYDKVDMAWGYYEIWMPYWLTIYYSGGLENGIHGIPISPVSGRWDSWDYAVGNYPITYGCVMPHDWDAEMLYEWADIGIPVSILY